MLSSIHSRLALVTAALAFFANVADAGAQASPAPSASPTERVAIVSCIGAAFFAWPDRHVAPQPTHYPPARVGDAFHVIGTGTITPGEMNLTETTIDVVEPYGAGKHYWVSTNCIT